MEKKYQSGSAVSVSIILASGKSKHIAFTGLSGGGSVYQTSNEDIQNGLEKHARFGKLFKLVDIPEEEEEPQVETEEPQQDNIEIVEVSDLGTAKDYLADRFGISRTSLNSKAKIVKAAAERGIEFKGI
jgi:hypothetical protein